MREIIHGLCHSILIYSYIKIISLRYYNIIFMIISMILLGMMEWIL